MSLSRLSMHEIFTPEVKQTVIDQYLVYDLQVIPSLQGEDVNYV